MLPSPLIVFREVFEAGLIVGIVMAVTSGVAGRGRWVAGGVAAGVLGACMVALFTGGLSQLFSGNGQELFNAAILSFAVLMLGWHNVWKTRSRPQTARKSPGLRLEPIREVWIHDEGFAAASRLSMTRIIARRMNATTVAA
jgi:high-affinity iron transporter